MAQMNPGGRKLARSRPTECRYWSHWQSETSVFRVNEVNFEAARFQDLVNGNPVNAGRLHRHRANPALHQPVGQRMQIASKGGKATDGLRVSISADSNVQFAGANINARSIWMKDWQCVTSSLALLGHLLLRSCRSDARGAGTEQTPNRDRRRKPANVITRLYATPDPRFSVGLGTGHQCRRGL